MHFIVERESTRKGRKGRRTFAREGMKEEGVLRRGRGSGEEKERRGGDRGSEKRENNVWCFSRTD